VQAKVNAATIMHLGAPSASALSLTPSSRSRENWPKRGAAEITKGKFHILSGRVLDNAAKDDDARYQVSKIVAEWLKAKESYGSVA
jgi:hypothetical protein